MHSRLLAIDDLLQLYTVNSILFRKKEQKTNKQKTNKKQQQQQKKKQKKNKPIIEMRILRFITASFKWTDNK